MSLASLEMLVNAQRLLVAALDADDVEAIGRHTAAVEQALVPVRAFSSQDLGAAARQLASEAMALTEAARVRVNVLADRTSRRITRLAVATGKGNAAPTYGRTGRMMR